MGIVDNQASPGSNYTSKPFFVRPDGPTVQVLLEGSGTFSGNISLESVLVVGDDTHVTTIGSALTVNQDDNLAVFGNISPGVLYRVKLAGGVGTLSRLYVTAGDRANALS